MAAEYRGIWLVKVYASSGTTKQQERERFYNNELPYLLRASPSNMIVGGDFNCVLNQTDSNYSKTIDKLVRGFELQDMWLADPLRAISRTTPRWEHQGLTRYIQRKKSVTRR